MTIEIDYPAIVPINETFTISWKADGVKSIEVYGYGEVVVRGRMELKLSRTETLTFILVSQSGFKSRKTIKINVAHRAVINEFKADKLFTYDDVPVILSWNCSNAKNIEIKTIGQQPQTGSLLVNPKIETCYTLSVTDDFGTQTKSVTIRILPLPIIKNLWIPAPDINKNVGIMYYAPKFKLSIPIPSFDTVFSKIKLPDIPQLSKSAYYVHSIESSKKQKTLNILQSLFSIFARKK